MTSPQARKGGAFERLIYSYLTGEFGAHVVRPRVTTADVGDIHVVPLIALELKCYTDLARGCREGLAQIAAERVNSGLPHGAVVLKRHGTTDPASQLVVQELGSASAMWRESLWFPRGDAS